MSARPYLPFFCLMAFYGFASEQASKVQQKAIEITNKVELPNHCGVIAREDGKSVNKNSLK